MTSHATSRSRRRSGSCSGPVDDWDYATEPEPACDDRAHVLAARQGARRLLLDQRDDLHPRQPAGLRRLARRRLRRLGVRRRPAVLPALGGQRPAAHRSTTTAAGRSPSPSSARPARCRWPMSRRPSQAGFARNPDFNGERPGRRRSLRRDPARRSAMLDVEGVPASPAMKRRNLSVVTGALATRVDHRARAGGWRRGRRRRPPAAVPGRPRGRARRRFGQHAAAAVAVRASGRPMSLREHGIDVVVDSPNVGRNLQDHVSVGGDRGTARIRSRCSRPTSGSATSPLHDPAPRPVHLGGRRGRRLHPDRSRAGRRRTCSCCSPRRCSWTTASPTRPGTASRWRPTC